ncbi:hypothetical protein HN51_016608 [Arachis hypogaea]
MRCGIGSIELIFGGALLTGIPLAMLLPLFTLNMFNEISKKERRLEYDHGHDDKFVYFGCWHFEKCEEVY